MTRTVRVAAVQAAPEFLDRATTTAKAVACIAEAAGNGAELIVLPETFIPCYPFWIWLADSGTVGGLYPRLLDQAVELESECVATLQQAARDAGAIVACGINERAGGTIYNSQLLIDDTGEVLGVRRKLMPTSAERAVWGRGDARDLRVWDTKLGVLGALICYEHSMTAARAALAGLGEEIHIAMWPSFPAESATDDVRVVTAVMQGYGWDSQSFVVHASSLVSESMVAGMKQCMHPATHELIDAFALMSRGTTGIVDPTGHHIAGPVYEGEQIVYADLDPEVRARAKFMIDSAGHYARPDVVRTVIADPAPPVVERQASPAPAGNGKAGRAPAPKAEGAAQD